MKTTALRKTQQQFNISTIKLNFSKLAQSAPHNQHKQSLECSFTHNDLNSLITIIEVLRTNKKIFNDIKQPVSQVRNQADIKLHIYDNLMYHLMKYREFLQSNSSSKHKIDLNTEPIKNLQEKQMPPNFTTDVTRKNKDENACMNKICKVKVRKITNYKNNTQSNHRQKQNQQGKQQQIMESSVKNVTSSQQLNHEIETLKKSNKKLKYLVQSNKQNIEKLQQEKESLKLQLQSQQNTPKNSSMSLAITQQIPMNISQKKKQLNTCQQASISIAMLQSEPILQFQPNQRKQQSLKDQVDAYRQQAYKNSRFLIISQANIIDNLRTQLAKQHTQSQKKSRWVQY